MMMLILMTMLIFMTKKNFMNYNLMMYFMNNMLMTMFIYHLMFNKILYYSMKIFWMMFIDYYSYYLIMLSIWISMLMIITMPYMMKMSMYMKTLSMMIMALMMTFMSINYMMFYFFFELSIIPTLMMIMGWGMQLERIEATLYIFMYMMFSSLPMMIIIIKLFNLTNSLNMITSMNMNLINNIYSYIYLIFTFLMKTPMFMIHMWLPKAHVEAPIIGSMILASIMLKLGSYGLMRMMLIMEKLCMKYNFIPMTMSLMGALFISMVCIIQNDLKMIIAYSSIVHMGTMTSNLMTMSMSSYQSSILIMISHGLCSSSLFFIININYKRLKSRSMIINKGMMNLMPSLTLFWFLLSIFNTAAPPSLSLFGEIMLINNLLMWNHSMIMMIMMISMFTMIYMMYFYSSTQHGTMFKNMNTFINCNLNEYLILTLHSLPISYIILMF